MKALLFRSLAAGSFLCVLSAQAAPDVSVHSFTSANAGQANRSDFTNTPGVVNYSEDAMGLTEWGPVWVGIGGSIRLVRQFTGIKPSSGSLDGTRWEFYPVVAKPVMIFGSDVEIALAPIFWAGRYSLSNKTAAGSSVAYKMPLGGRVFFTHDRYNIGPFPRAGITLFGDYVVYGKLNDSSSGDTKLTDNHLKVWTAGLALHLEIL